MGLFDKVKDKASKAVSEQFGNLKTKDIGGKNIGDMIKPLEDATNNAILNHQEDKNEQKIFLPVKKSFSKQLDSITLRRDTNNYFYVSKKYDPNATKYKFERFEWGGSTMTQETITTGNIKTKGRTGQTIAGAALLGPAGAIIGSTGKRKSKVDTKSTTTTTEIGSEGKIFLRSIEDNSIKEVSVFLDSAQASNLERFIANIDYTENTIVENTNEHSSVQQLKELKELLDLGILTQEEFELKKKEILGL
ncbi:SHOCT domain-containing protein [Enterococcus sp.]|uniref:SHOCT domain-containing protein n=1 Tax=Enterococcus sp. TaxID=35783 RepID=UPI0028A2D2C8|nr:SHOCT domain-containing protein [Enterococcus sp.]